jgi:hypothetical protein
MASEASRGSSPSRTRTYNKPVNSRKIEGRKAFTFNNFRDYQISFAHGFAQAN